MREENAGLYAPFVRIIFNQLLSQVSKVGLGKLARLKTLYYRKQKSQKLQVGAS